jgi:aldose 1-epimerase
MTANSELLHLASGPWELEVQPGRGGAVTALRHRGRLLLVSPDPGTTDAMGAASFALVPYANRIAAGRFDHRGQWQLPRNFGEHAHPLHGTGWKRPWQVAALQADALALQLQHQADAHWPWSFTAQQRIQLLPDAIRFELAATNTAAEPAPMGLGFHPAFAAGPDTTLRTQLEGVWQIDADSLPESHAPAGAVLPELPGAVKAHRSKLVDHCFTGWSRALRIERAGAAGEFPIVEMTASPALHFLQLYMPPGRSSFCIEPMSQMPDAIHHPEVVGHGGLQFLQPGTTLQVWMQLALR